MAEGVTDGSAADWKRDPTGRFAGRYWDGAAWTEHVVGKDRVRSQDPLPTDLRPSPPAPGAPPAGPGAPAPRGGNGWPRWAKVAVAAAVVVGIALALRPDGKSERPAAVVAAPPTKSEYQLGETARTGGLDVTVYAFNDPQPAQGVLQPGEGRHFVSIDVQVANPGPTGQLFSSLLGFKLFDADETEFDATISDLSPPPPDGRIAPRRTVRGLAVFEVPDGVAGFRLLALGNLAEAGATFRLG